LFISIFAVHFNENCKVERESVESRESEGSTELVERKRGRSDDRV